MKTIALIAFGVIGGFLMGVKASSLIFNQMAVKEGVGEYYLNEGNDKHFRLFIPPCTHQQLPQRVYDDEEENGFRDVPYEGSE